MLDDIIQERLKKLSNLQKEGINPYSSKNRRNVAIGEIIKKFRQLLHSKKSIFIAGRITGLRDQGNLIFIDLSDESGKIQGILRKDKIENFKIFKNNLDIGDFVSLQGSVFITKAGEKSIAAEKIAILAKSLRPLPVQWYGLKDVEERFRKRYLDFIFNPKTKEKIVQRSRLVDGLRKLLENEGFLEVETPIFQPIAGGARARPFITHHNTLNVDFYLRIAPELYLKRLLIGGFEKVFEIGRNFRNEGIDREHNPEFTMLEIYWAYTDWEGLINFIEKILKRLVRLNRKYLPADISKVWLKKWPKIAYADTFKKYAKIDIKKIKDKDIDEIFKKEVRPKIIQPTIITHYPKSISPLAKSFADNPGLTERFQLIVNGAEIVNGFSELNNPIEQRRRMEEQEKLYRAGDKEASRLDEDFLEALEYGMPPAAGLGIGIDRLVAILTGSYNIKEIIIFPTLRTK